MTLEYTAKVQGVTGTSAYVLWPRLGLIISKARAPGRACPRWDSGLKDVIMTCKIYTET